MSIIDLNIQPQASVYSIFTRLNYTEWNALAEFVDNSTASYFLHQEELEATTNNYKLIVEINYDPSLETITIEDNAFGMEIDDFKRAILLDAKPIDQSGRNEFGMGLKTAATWFGRRWSVESTEYESTRLFQTTVDLDNIVETKSNNIKINVFDADYYSHYTKITISKLNRKLNTASIKKKIVKLLEGMYRRDLLSGNIEIMYNGITLSFSEIVPLQFRGQTWKKDIAFSFDFEGKHYPVTGFVGIMEKGGYDDAGLALFRRGRVVVGGFGQNYKPRTIFGQSQSQISLKLYGEINMDAFEINQAKDGISWTTELEEMFLENLKLAIKDYISVAQMSIKERQAEEKGKEVEEKPTPQVSTKPKEHDNNAIETVVTAPAPINNSTPSNNEITEGNNGNLEYSFIHQDQKYNVVFVEISNKKNLFEFKQSINTVNVNKNHDFIRYGNGMNETTAIVVLAYAIAEQKAKAACTNEGYISAATLRNQFSKILQEIKKA